MSVVLRTWTHDASDILYSYEIVVVENRKTGEDEFIVYRHLGPLRYKVCGRYDDMIDAVKGLHRAMKHEIYEDA